MSSAVLEASAATNADCHLRSVLVSLKPLSVVSGE